MNGDGLARSESERRLRLHRDRFPGAPLLDTAVSHAMLRRVAVGAADESLRLYVPDNALLFSSLDSRRPGYDQAIALAEEAGFPAVVRLAGGEAAAFLDESIAFAWAIPDADAHLHIRPRFEALADWIAASLQSLDLDARVGPIEGEYCPGEYSVNIGGRVKVMGVGQRVIRGGAHVGGVLTVSGTDRLRGVLGPVYEALGLEFRPQTAGGVSDFDPDLGVEDVLGAMQRSLRARGYALDSVAFDDAIRDEAEALVAVHAPERRSGLGRALRASRRDAKVLHERESHADDPDPGSSADP